MNIRYSRQIARFLFALLFALFSFDLAPMGLAAPTLKDLKHNGYIRLLTDVDTLEETQGILPKVNLKVILFQNFFAFRNHHWQHGDKAVVLCIPFSELKGAVLEEEAPPPNTPSNWAPLFTLRLQAPLKLTKAYNRLLFFCHKNHMSAVKRLMPNARMRHFDTPRPETLHQQIKTTFESKKIAAWYLKLDGARLTAFRGGEVSYKSVLITHFLKSLLQEKSPWLTLALSTLLPPPAIKPSPVIAFESIALLPLGNSTIEQGVEQVPSRGIPVITLTPSPGLPNRGSMLSPQAFSLSASDEYDFGNEEDLLGQELLGAMEEDRKTPDLPPATIPQATTWQPYLHTAVVWGGPLGSQTY